MNKEHRQQHSWTWTWKKNTDATIYKWKRKKIKYRKNKLKWTKHFIRSYWWTFIQTIHKIEQTVWHKAYKISLLLFWIGRWKWTVEISIQPWKGTFNIRNGDFKTQYYLG